MAAQNFSVTIQSDPADIRVAREFVAEVARRLCGADLDVPALKLLVSEIVGNAVALDAGPITVAVRPMPTGELRVEVRDDGWGQPEVAEDAAPHGGHGLRILERVAFDWGVEQFVPGKIVWFTIEV